MTELVEHVLYEGTVHWAKRWMLGFRTREPFVGFLCTGKFHPEKSVAIVIDDVDCMTCLVTRARKERR